MRLTCPILRPGLAVLALTLAFAPDAGLATPASAQFGEAAGFGEMMSPYFLRRDLEIFAEGLELDEGQAVIVEQIYYDYEDEHETGKARMLERLSSMREDLEGLDAGSVLINDSTDYRLDSMPFGGVKKSGIGREGIRFSLAEMTEPKVVCWYLPGR